ncbi:Competence protein CoiA-like family protein [Planococcus massiliensis]|uniref:Competence protein CoiA-like family protein n=1 Tax=Planococcus massiliensis TaxID=1499687 RepID=A0A098EK53_9BACL|nr:competence protein CoiA family protein [Planococcus massiliensis]CEG22267.1 Competence protein CoiA-like family protein [Planococcus massiliensis]
MLIFGNILTIEWEVFSILIASLANRSIINLSHIHQKESLLALREKERFYCSRCHTPVVLKVGDIKIPHFAHKTLSGCDYSHEPESSLHLHGKLSLLQFFQNRQLQCELEKFLPAIRQRADLLVEGRTAIEFQCSTIPQKDVVHRTEGYLQLGIEPIWIGGLDDPPNESIQIIRLKTYETELFQHKGQNPYLLAFCPSENRFYYYSNLFYVSGSRRIGKVKSLDASRQSFPFAVPKRLSKEEFAQVCGLFSKTRQQFIQSQLFAKNRMQNLFWRACYTLQLDMKKLPISIGHPFIGAEIFPQHAVLWQLLAVEAFNGQISMAKLIESGKLVLADPGHFEKAVALLEQYLELFVILASQPDNFTMMYELLYDYYCNSV